MIEGLLVLTVLILQVSEVDDPPLFRQELVVTAERGAEERELLPAATSVLRREEIAAMPVDDLGGIIDRFPGITTLLEGAGSRPMLTARGFFGGGEVEYVQLLVDGVPVGDAESGLAEWSSIPVESIERVEFLRGPGSALYGDVALAGVIEVFTTRTTKAGETHVSLETGSFDTHEATARWSNEGAVDFGLSAALATTEGYRAHSAADRQYAEGSAGFDGAGGRFVIRLSSSTIEREEPGMLPLTVLEESPRSSDDLFRFDREESDRLRGSVDYERSGRVPVRALAWMSDRDSSLLRTVLLAAGLGDPALRRTSSSTLGSSLTASHDGVVAGRVNELRGGVDLSRDSVEAEYFAVGEDGARGTRTAAEDGSRDRFALFLTDHLELSARARVTVGLRYDALRDDFSREATHEAWSPRVGMNVRFGALDDRPYVFFAQAARAFKAPSLDQLFGQRPFPDFQGGSFTVSNPTLQPQRATNVEVGISRSSPVHRWEIVGYRMDVEDEIDFDVATFSYRNIGKSLHEGVEASTEWRLRSITPRVSYSWTRVESVGAGGGGAGRQLKNIPEHVVQLGAGMELRAAFKVDASLQLLSGWFMDDANSIAIDDQWQFDFRLRRDFGTWRGRIDVINALDEVGPHVGVVLPDFRGGEVPYAYPSTGRTFRVGVERTF